MITLNGIGIIVCSLGRRLTNWDVERLAKSIKTIMPAREEAAGEAEAAECLVLRVLDLNLLRLIHEGLVAGSRPTARTNKIVFGGRPSEEGDWHSPTTFSWIEPRSRWCGLGESR